MFARGKLRASEENGVSLEFHFDCLLCMGSLLGAGCSSRGEAVEVGVCAGRFSSRVLACFTSRVLAVFTSRVLAVCINVEAKGLSVLGSGISLGAVPTVGVGAEGLYIAVRVGTIVDVDSKTTQYLHDSNF